MKTAEFLNTKANYILQVLPEHAGDDPESGLLRVPDGAIKLTIDESKTLTFFKNETESMNVGQDHKWMSSKIHNGIYSWSEYAEYPYKLLWDRSELRSKVDEVRQHLGITNNNILSVMIGREKSYLRKLLKRKASSATVEKVIAELDALIDSQSEKTANAEICQTIGTASGGSISLEWLEKSMNIPNLKVKNGLLQNEIRELNQKLKLSDEIAEMWEDSYKRSFKLNAWLFLIIILFIGLFIAWWAL